MQCERCSTHLIPLPPGRPGKKPRFCSKRCQRAQYAAANAVRRGEQTQRWKSAHRARVNERARDLNRARYNADPAYRLKNVLRARLRARLRRALRDQSKSGSAVRDLGCSVQDLRVHLEAQFRPGMTWENWGRNGWHIDHIKPLASFDLTDREQCLKACHYTNLQPLWAEDNLSKGSRYGGK